MDAYNNLQLREIFHLEFLRWLSRKVKAENFALKGGSNLRFFFKSNRYSEDMDLDASGIRIDALQDIVMGILKSQSFADNIRPFGILRVSAPDITKAKQTETTQRFKAHLSAISGEDLFTKIEFSRRGFGGNIEVTTVDAAVTRAYKLAPIIIPHYDIQSCLAQKLNALSGRTVVQARDIFDIYILRAQYKDSIKLKGVKDSVFSKAYDRVFEVEFEQFADTVLAYLSLEDQGVYNSRKIWEDIRLKVAEFIEQMRKPNA